MPVHLKESDGGVELSVKAVPGASRSRIAGPLGTALKIQVAEPPEKGRANSAITALLAKAIGVPKNAVAVIAGHTNPHKTVRIEGVTAEQVRATLNLT